MKKTKDKLFIVRKYVKAKSAVEAIRKEKKMPPDDVYIDEEWKAGNRQQLAEAIGFEGARPSEDEDDDD